jgi:hypothetical protein
MDMFTAQDGQIFEAQVARMAMDMQHTLSNDYIINSKNDCYREKVMFTT